jgi:hypothetical protein
MELKTTLDEKMTEKFLVVKENIGVKDDKSVLGFLISKAYDKIQDTRYQKLWISNEVYGMAEKEAAAQNVTVDIYVTELVEKKLKELKEAEKHGKEN